MSFWKPIQEEAADVLSGKTTAVANVAKALAKIAELSEFDAIIATTAKRAQAAPASRTTVRANVTAGRVCPAPGASFGDGWGVARGSRSHKGMDMSGRRGSPILAIEAGVVIREGRQRNGALRIVLQGRSGSKFYYGHMSKDLVRAGSRVTRGQVIALMGDTGSPGQVHLHFEYWKSGGESAAVNPASLLRSLC